MSAWMRFTIHLGIIDRVFIIPFKCNYNDPLRILSSRHWRKKDASNV